MQIKFFNVPIFGGDSAQADLNHFLRTKKVLHTESHLLKQKTGSFWCFCIRYMDDTVSQPGIMRKEKKKPAVDYREILEPEVFERFSTLRSLRKKIAEEEAVPVYLVLTNEELAGLARLEVITEKAMKNIEGIGEKKLLKYGHRFVNSAL